MNGFNIKDIRILPSSLDLKGNSGKSLSDLLCQLQSSSFLKGLVVGTTPSGEIIFNTIFGRFAIPNVLGLQRGDTITLKFAGEGEHIQGKIMTVNNISNDSTEPLTLAFVKNSGQRQMISQKSTPPSSVTINNTSKLPEQIKGEITYLNLFKINKNSFLYKTLETVGNLNNKPLPVILKTSFPSQIFPSPLQIRGEIIDNGKNEVQLIKTSFGIITTTNTKIPVGQKLTLEIININNQDINLNIKREIIDFMFNLSRNWQLVKQLAITSLCNANKETQVHQHILSSPLESELISTRFPVPNLQDVSSRSAKGANLTLKNTTQIAQNEELMMSNAMSKEPQIIAGLNIRKERAVDKDISLIKQEIRQRNQEEATLHLSKVNSNKLSNVNNFLKAFSDYEVIKKLSSEYRVIKELFVINTEREDKPNSWQPVMIPFYNGQEITEKEIKFNRPSEQLLRFLIDLKLEVLGEIRIDGLIKFQNHTNSVTSFDLIMRSKNSLERELVNTIAEIYKLNQKMIGFKGELSFDESSVF